MLKRVHIRGFKSLADVEVRLEPLTVLFGPTASGKSNFLDALLLLSKLGTSLTLKDAFDYPYRGKPIESFPFGKKGIEGLVDQERLAFSIEADLELSEAVVYVVNRQIRNLRRSGGQVPSGESGRQAGGVRARNLRYRIAIEMQPRSGTLRVTDEYLAALNSKGELAGRRKPFLERRGDKLHQPHEGRPQVTHHDRFLDHSVLSMPHYPPHHPHLAAARAELESWLFFHFEPRERMRAASPLKEVRRIGPAGEELAAFLNTTKEAEPDLFRCVERELTELIPRVDGIEIEVSDLGEVELRLNEGGVTMPARLLSEGTLRQLALAALTAVVEPPALVAVEEPETGVHPRRIPMIAQMLEARSRMYNGLHSQYIVTTHDPFLPDLVSTRSLFVVERTKRTNDETRIVPFSTWRESRRRRNVQEARRDDRERTRIGSASCGGTSVLRSSLPQDHAAYMERFCTVAGEGR